MFYELAQLAVGNLRRARARLFMTAGGVMVGTAAVILLIAITLGLQNAAEAGIGSSSSLVELSVYAGWSPDMTSENMPQLDQTAVDTFWALPGVAAVVPIAYVYGLEIRVGDLIGQPMIVGLDPSLLPYLGATVTQGELRLNHGDMLIGARAQESFYDPTANEWRPETVDVMNASYRLTLRKYGPTVSTRRLNAAFSGALQATGSFYDYAVLVPFDEMIRIWEWMNDQRYNPATFRYDQIIVRATSRDTTSAVAEGIRALGHQVGGAVDFLNQLNGFFGTMRLMLGGIGGIALIVAAFGVANTMTMAILERTKEIGLMKAVGATDQHILTVFLVEAGLVGFSGGLVGVGVSLLLQSVINQAVESAGTGGGGPMFLPIDPAMIQGNLIIIPPELMIFGIALATLVGLGAGFYPALRAARLQPVIALKSE